jgi:hypothetical protein
MEPTFQKGRQTGKKFYEVRIAIKASKQSTRIEYSGKTATLENRAWEKLSVDYSL